MNERHYDPPRLSAALLGWLLKDDWSTPLGDYEEYYNELVENEGEMRARWWYRGQVLRLVPDRLFEKLYWGRSMFNNYFKLGFRNLKKNKTVSLINILGLTGAIGCAITVFLFLRVVNASDDFHEQADSLYLIGHTVDQMDRLEKWGNTPATLGPALVDAFPQIERMTRISRISAMVQGETSAFQEGISFAEPAFLEMFTFPLRNGSSAVLEDPQALILSAAMADKYFNGRNPMGETVEVTFDNGVVLPFAVRGVAEPFPGQPSLQFDFLVSLDNLARVDAASLTDWSRFVDATVIQVASPADAAFIEQHLQQYIPQQNEANPTWKIQGFFLDNIGDPGWRAWEITRRVMRAPDPWAILVMGAIALMTLLVASFNYINISLGFADRRLTEIGIRKTAGAEKKQLVWQLLTENLILCLIALVLGVLFAGLVLIPLFNDLFVEEISFDFYRNAGFWLYLVGLLVFLGLVSGAYPAFYISSFQPVAILRGFRKPGKKRRLTQMLLTVQFALSLVTIMLCTVAFSMGDFFMDRPWGYEAEDTVVVPILNKDQYLKMRDAGLQLPNVETVSGAVNHVGDSRATTNIDIEGETRRVLAYNVGESYIASLALKMSVGRSFEGLEASEEAGVVIVNQAFVEAEGWQEPVGRTIRLEGQSLVVIGVVADFLTDPMFGQQLPAFFRLVDPGDFNYVTLRVAPGTADQVMAALERTWKQFFPEVPFTSYAQIDVFEGFYTSIRNIARNIGYLALFALLVSCMGLFGMASQKASQHLKEVGVRKVMGASPASVVFLVNRGFLIILVIASLIATPLCYFVLKMLLSMAPAEIPLTLWPFVTANLVLFAVAALALVSQIRRLVRVSPAEILRV